MALVECIITRPCLFLTHGNEFPAEGIVVWMHPRCDQPLAELLGTNGLALDAEALTNCLPGGNDGRVLGLGLLDKTCSSGCRHDMFLRGPKKQYGRPGKTGKDERLCSAAYICFAQSPMRVDRTVSEPRDPRCSVDVTSVPAANEPQEPGHTVDAPTVRCDALEAGLVEPADPLTTTDPVRDPLGTTDRAPSPARGVDSRAAAPGSDTPAIKLPAVPGYRVVREIARGGMGGVLAPDDLSLDREVALTVLLPGANAERFVRVAGFKTPNFRRVQCILVSLAPGTVGVCFHLPGDGECLLPPDK